MLSLQFTTLALSIASLGLAAPTSDKNDFAACQDQSKLRSDHPDRYCSKTDFRSQGAVSCFWNQAIGQCEPTKCEPGYLLIDQHDYDDRSNKICVGTQDSSCGINKVPCGLVENGVGHCKRAADSTDTKALKYECQPDCYDGFAPQGNTCVAKDQPSDSPSHSESATGSSTFSSTQSTPPTFNAPSSSKAPESSSSSDSSSSPSSISGSSSSSTDTNDPPVGSSTSTSSDSPSTSVALSDLSALPTPMSLSSVSNVSGGPSATDSDSPSSNIKSASDSASATGSSPSPSETSETSDRGPTSSTKALPDISASPTQVSPSTS